MLLTSNHDDNDKPDGDDDDVDDNDGNVGEEMEEEGVSASDDDVREGGEMGGGGYCNQCLGNCPTLTLGREKKYSNCFCNLSPFMVDMCFNNASHDF